MTADVFVAIAALSDPDVVETIESIRHAPGRSIRVAVFLQDDDAKTIRALREIDDIDLVHVPTRTARGVGFARAIAASMYENEPWYYQCDSHACFHDNWAEDLIAMADRLDEKAIISTYPRSRECYKPTEITLIEPFLIGDAGLMGRCQDYPASMFDGTCQKARLVGGGHFFAPGDFVADIPYDPHMLFAGEEFSVTIRAWTNGYNLYHPNSTVTYHLYDLEGRRKFIWDYYKQFGERDVFTKRRVATLLGKDSIDMGVYGLGTARTYASYEEYAGCDMLAETFEPGPYLA